jgi:hypothetical protein
MTTSRTATAVKTADGDSGASEGYLNILPIAKANGAKGWIKRLRRFDARSTPIEPAPSRRRYLTKGSIVEVVVSDGDDVRDPGELIDYAREALRCS